MTTLTETGHAGGFMVSEAQGTRSREAVTVLSGQNLLAGAVVGAVAHGSASAAAVAGNTGDGTVGAVTLGAGAKAGEYKLTATAATKFQVEDPEGVTLGVATTGAAFNKGGLSFTMTAGATPFVAGDAFVVTVATGSSKVKEWNPANTDGSEVAVGVLWDDVDASSADAPGVIVKRDAEVNGSELVWFTGATSNDKALGATHLAGNGIIVR